MGGVLSLPKNTLEIKHAIIRINVASVMLRKFVYSKSRPRDSLHIAVSLGENAMRCGCQAVCMEKKCGRNLGVIENMLQTN